MSNGDFVYGKARQAIGAGQINLLTGPVNAMLVSAAYSPLSGVDQHVSDIPSGAILVRDYALTGVAINSSGVFHGTIPPFNTFSSGGTLVVACVLYVKLSSDAVSPLLYYSSTGPGFPFQAQGFNYTVGYDQANGGYFQI